MCVVTLFSRSHFTLKINTLSSFYHSIWPGLGNMFLRVPSLIVWHPIIHVWGIAEALRWSGTVDCLLNYNNIQGRYFCLKRLTVIHTYTDGGFWGSVSWPRTISHADQGNWTSDLPIRCWLHPLATNCPKDIICKNSAFKCLKTTRPLLYILLHCVFILSQNFKCVYQM